MVIPLAVQALYVRPNELKLELGYIDRHIQATRRAYGIDSGTERPFSLADAGGLDVEANATLIDNIRPVGRKSVHRHHRPDSGAAALLPLRDMDIDRYRIDGKVKQVLLSPREIDVDALSSEARNWINRHFVYTHGYGVVASEVNRTTPQGLPVLLIQDAAAGHQSPGYQDRAA